jgi:putative ABC transport system permease protein
VMLNQMMVARMEVMLEDINLLITIAPLSLILAVVLGVGAVALTPLLSVLKLRRIDIPSTLRVME